MSSKAQLVIKKPRVSLDTIPEDAAINVIRFVQEMAEVGGTDKIKERARRLRDSTLRAVAMSCWGTFNVYQTALLAHITLNLKTAFSFVKFLQECPNTGGMVKSVHFLGKQHIDHDTFHEAISQLAAYSETVSNIKLSFLSPSKVQVPTDTMGHIRNGAKVLMRQFYERLGQPQVLVIQHPWCLPPLVSPRSKSKLIPSHFFSSSLKRLHITKFTAMHSDEFLTAKNALWILLWCSHLQELSLSFSLSKDDVTFLSDHQAAFTGLSNVKHLAIDFFSVVLKAEKKTWFGSKQELAKRWRGGNAKTQGIIDLLSVTKDLESLEIFQTSCTLNEGDFTGFFSNCLIGAQASAKSLTKLRMIGIGADRDDPKSTVYGIFENLKVLSVEQMPLIYLSRFPEMSLPPSLQIITLPHSSYQPSGSEWEWNKGELNLVQLLKSRSLPNLKVVIVPSEPIDQWGEIVLEDLEFKRVWSERRKELEGLKMFKKSKVELRKLTMKELIENPYREDSFLSTVSWLSVPYERS